MTRVRTMCPMNCHPTLCGMLVDVEDGRLVGVAGDPDNPDSRGFLCVRGHASREIVGNAARLLHPLVRARRDGAWQPATWDDALDLIAARLRAAGAEAVGVWAGHGVFANNYGSTDVADVLAAADYLATKDFVRPDRIGVVREAGTVTTPGRRSALRCGRRSRTSSTARAPV